MLQTAAVVRTIDDDHDKDQPHQEQAEDDVASTILAAGRQLYDGPSANGLSSNYHYTAVTQAATIAQI